MSGAREDGLSAAGVAIFDLDGTLTTRDTFLAFLLTFGRRYRRWAALARTPPRLAAYLARLCPDYRLKQALIVDYLASVDPERVAEHRRWFCAHWLPRRLHPVGMALLRGHRQRGDRVILLSASPDIFVPHVAAELGIDEVLCTRIERRGDGWSGRMVDGNCKGARKLEVIRDYLGCDAAPPRSYAYGDSPGDRYVLQWVEHGAWIRRRRLQPLTASDASWFPCLASFEDAAWGASRG